MMVILRIISILLILSALIAAAVISADLRRRPQPMRIMNAVWILTGLWAGVAGLWAYFSFGRTGGGSAMRPDRKTPVRPMVSYPLLPETDCGPKLRDAAVPETTGPVSARQKETNPVQADSAKREARAAAPMPMQAGAAMETTSRKPLKSHASPDSGNYPEHTETMRADSSSAPADMREESMKSMAADDSGVSPGSMKMNGMSMQDMRGEKPMARSTGSRAGGMNGMQGEDMRGMPMPMGPVRPKWQRTALSTLHCGAGCTLADLLGEWFAVLVPVSIGGSLIAGSWALDYVLALVIGIGFQYAAIRGMESISPGKALGRAAQADILSLTAWQIGMYGWMALVYFVLFPGNPPEKTSWTFWFMMQLAMGFGFAASYPMNMLLIRLGIKKAM